MTREFPSHTGGPVSIRVEIVDGADVVETTTGDEVSTRSICAGHDPRRSERNGVNLVGCICVPDYELAILGGRHQMPPICRPMHGVNLGEMPLQCLLRPHHLALRDGLLLLLSNSSD